MKRTGTVKSYRTKNGCGFIISDVGDVFVHVSNIVPNEGEPADLLVPGEQVEYEMFESRRGHAASNVVRLNPPRCTDQFGTVKRTFDERGYGFIDSRDGDVFFHYADCLFDNPQPGEWVNYLLTTVNGRPRALKVRRHTENG